MDTFITKVEIFGLHDQFDVRQDFSSGVNIIYGDSGDFNQNRTAIVYFGATKQDYLDLIDAGDRHKPHKPNPLRLPLG